MKIELRCPSCFGMQGFFAVAIRDDGYYDVKCPAGHRYIYCVPQQLYEVLFDTAINAAADGYFREAVSSWATSLERFYEFFVRVLGAASGTPLEQFQQVWRELASSSERQYGAFIIASMIAHRKAPNVLTNKEREFRNSVVHKGVIPTEEQSLAFGEKVRFLIANTYQSLASTYPEPLRITCLIYKKSIEDRVPPNVSPVHWYPVSNIYRASTGMDSSEVSELVRRTHEKRKAR